ncbi:MAG: ParB/RepB/Spo0J family partition protein, partial [Desulfobacteraceae bacterium]
MERKPRTKKQPEIISPVVVVAAALAEAEKTVVSIADLRMIPVSKIHLDPNQPREVYNKASIAELAESMIKNGFDVGFAIIVRPHPEIAGEFMAIVGHRRTLAAKEAKLSEIPCQMRTDLSEQGIYELQLLENEKRQDLTIMNRVRATQRGLDRGMTLERLAEVFTVSVATLQKDLELQSLSKDLHVHVDEGRISKDVARKLATSPLISESQQLWAWNNLLRDKRTSAAMVAALDAYLDKLAQKDLFADAKKAAADNGGLMKIRKASVALQKSIVEFEKRNYHTDPNVVSARKNELPTLKQLVASLERIAKG